MPRWLVKIDPLKSIIIIIIPEEWPTKHKNKTNIDVHKLPDKFLKHKGNECK